MIKAVITTLSDNETHIFNAQDEDAIATFLYKKFPKTTCEVSLVPLFMDASGWCPLASIGEVYECKDLVIRIEDLEV